MLVKELHIINMVFKRLKREYIEFPPNARAQVNNTVIGNGLCVTVRIQGCGWKPAMTTNKVKFAPR